MKEHLCATEGGPYDPVAIAHVQVTGGNQIAAAIVIEGGGNPVDALPSVVLSLRLEHGDLDWVVFMADSYIKLGPADEPRPRQGDLGKAFEAGTDPAVREALVASFATNEGRRGFTNVPYRYDGTTPVFEDPTTMEGDPTGNVFNALKLAFEPLDRLTGS